MASTGSKCRPPTFFAARCLFCTLDILEKEYSDYVLGMASAARQCRRGAVLASSAARLHPGERVHVLGVASAASNFKTSCFGMTNHHSDPWRPRSATSVRRCDATALFGGMLHGRPCLNEHPVVRPRLTSKGRPAARLNTRLVAADNRPALLAVRSLSLAVRLCLWRHVHTVQVSPAASCLISLFHTPRGNL